MNPLRFFKYATLALIVLNLAIVAFFFMTKPAPPGKRGGREFQKRAIDMLKLDAAQETAFIQSARQHNQHMEDVNAQQQRLLKPFFQSIVDTSGSQDRETILNEVLLLERNKIELTYQHFTEVKSLLNKEQLPDFARFMDDALGIILLNPKRNPPPPKGF